jgi:hypothetical protein
MRWIRWRCRGEEVAEAEAVELGGAEAVAQGESFFGTVVFGVDVDAEGTLSFREVHDLGDLAGDIGWVRAGVRLTTPASCVIAIYDGNSRGCGLAASRRGRSLPEQHW